MINIQDIIPFMEDGWVAMDKDGAWCWFDEKPVASVCDGRWVTTNHCISECINTVINIAPADDWTKSLIKVGEMSELKIIPVTLKRYNELVDNGEIDKTAFYKIVDDEEKSYE